MRLAYSGPLPSHPFSNAVCACAPAQGPSHFTREGAKAPRTSLPCALP
jgi:hypothetical protein